MLEEANLVGGRLGLEPASVNPGSSQVAVTQTHGLAVNAPGKLVLSQPVVASVRLSESPRLEGKLDLRALLVLLRYLLRLSGLGPVATQQYGFLGR